MSSVIHHRRAVARKLIWIAAPASLLSLACSNDKPEARAVPAPVEVTPPKPVAERIDDPVDTAVELDEGVRSACTISEARDDSPQFEFDSARLRARGTDILDGVAACVLTGSLKDHMVTLVGHADPRGSEAYNQQLGLQRAESTRDYLISRGVPRSSVAVTSRGEQDATGQDEAGWQRDRHVQIESAGKLSSR